MQRLIGALLVVSVALAFPSLATSQEFVLAWGTHGTGPGQFDRPVALAVNSTGEVYVGDSRQSYVQRFTSDGAFLGSCEMSGGSPCPVAIALAIDRGTDRVIASNPSQSAIQVYSRDLAPITGWNGAAWGGVGVAYGIAVGPAGDLFIAGGAGHSVSCWTQDGALIKRWADPGPGPGQLQSAWGIAVDASGFVYVAEYAGSRVLKFTTEGVFVTAWGGFGSGPGQLSSPTDISVSPSGMIYVADPYNNRIQEFTPEGAFLSTWGVAGQGPGEFSEPYGVATYGTYVFVGDAGNSRIQKFGYLPTTTKRTTWSRLKAAYR